MLTRKHFQSIARILGRYEANEEVIDAFVSYLHLMNPRFDELMFRDAVRIARGR